MKLACNNMPVGGAVAMSATGDLDINVGETTISNPNMVRIFQNLSLLY